jgi:putative DNA primase/helicase
MEGELNAIASWFALAGKVDVVGLPGVEGAVPWSHLRGRRVYLYADGDEGGRAAVERWKGEAARAGVAVCVLEPLPEGLDACEYASRYGQGALGAVLTRRLQ